MRKGLLLAIIISLSSAFSAHAQSTLINGGLSWLGTQANPDGSLGNITSTTDITRTTVAVIDTLQALGQTNTTFYSNAVSWLQGQSISTTDYLSERMFTLLSGGSDEGLLVSYIDNASGVWGGYEGYGINNLDTLLALQALKSVNYSNFSTISNALSYLVIKQNSDGSWNEDAYSTTYKRILFTSNVLFIYRNSIRRVNEDRFS